jgi:hypothetical protein
LPFSLSIAIAPFKDWQIKYTAKISPPLSLAETGMLRFTEN